MSLFIKEFNNENGPSVFTTWEIHKSWLSEYNIDGIFCDRRKIELCCQNAKPCCQWCVIDFIIKNNINKLIKKWRIKKKNRFNNIKLREIIGK